MDKMDSFGISGAIAGPVSAAGTTKKSLFKRSKEETTEPSSNPLEQVKHLLSEDLYKYLSGLTPLKVRSESTSLINKYWGHFKSGEHITKNYKGDPGKEKDGLALLYLSRLAESDPDFRVSFEVNGDFYEFNRDKIFDIAESISTSESNLQEELKELFINILEDRDDSWYSLSVPPEIPLDYDSLYKINGPRLMASHGLRVSDRNMKKSKQLTWETLKNAWEFHKIKYPRDSKLDGDHAQETTSRVLQILIYNSVVF